jgi:hypothetical protein
MSLLHQLLRGALVEVQALGLDVRGMRSLDLRPFVPVQPQPPEGVQGGFHRPWDNALLVGILYPQNKDPAMVAGEEPVEEGRPEVAHVGLAGGAGGVADAYLHRH